MSNPYFALRAVTDDHIPLTVMFTPAQTGGVQATACATDLGELEAWIAHYKREYPPGGYGTMVLAGPYREAQHWAVKLWRGCSCE